MEVIITQNYQQMSEQAFLYIKEVVVNNPHAVLGLATGTTPLGLYKCMIEDHKQNGTSYANVTAVNLDEYAGLEKTHNQSYAYFMKHNLFDGLDIKAENTNIENGMAADIDEECKRYNDILNKFERDIQVLGIGSNGHIAFNEPFTPFDSQTHIVDLTESTIKDNARLFDSIDDVPRKAFTMGLKNIMDAKKVLVLANGKNKAKAVYELVKGAVREEVPATILQKHSNVVLVCDAEAASLLN